MKGNDMIATMITIHANINTIGMKTNMHTIMNGNINSHSQNKYHKCNNRSFIINYAIGKSGAISLRRSLRSLRYISFSVVFII